MFEWLKDHDAVDPSPTAADFPVRIWAEEEIGRAYYAYLKPYLGRGLPLSALLFVPRPKYEEDGREYMLADLEEGILYLERQADGSVFVRQLDSRHIGAVCLTEDLLRGCISVYWQETAGDYKIEMRFNRVRKELFYPVLNKLLGCNADYDQRKADVYLGVPEQMRQEQLALYRYVPEAGRFGSYLVDWQWWDTERIKRWRKKKRQKTSACALGRSEKGQVLIDLSGSRIDIWYLPDRRSSVSVREDSSYSRKLVIQLGYFDGKPVKELYIRKPK